MKRGKLVVRFVIDKRAGALILAAAVVGAAALRLSSETLTLSTTYPAPVGVYNQIITTGDAGTVPANTVLARAAGSVLLAPPSNPGGMVGVGVALPAAKLDVGGTIRAGRFPSDPSGAVDGSMYFNTTLRTLRVHDGRSWTDVGSAATGSFCGFFPLSGGGGPRGRPSSAPNIPCQGQDLSRGCPAGFVAVGLGVGVTCVRQ